MYADFNHLDFIIHRNGNILRNNELRVLDVVHIVCHHVNIH